MSEKDVEIVRTTTWSAGAGCHGGCGVLAHIKDGKLIKIEGDPEHPWNQGRICARCLAMTQYVYHPDRLQRPLKRTGKRGEDKWQEITWDEAFDFVEKKMKGIREKYGAESMVFIQGTGRDIGGWQSMLAHAYGSPNWFFGLSGVACYTPRLMVMWSQQGDFCVADASQWLPKRYDDPDYRVPECIIVWGQNLPASCPDAFFSHWLVDLMKRGSKLVVIDPRFTWLAARSEMWLQLRPGTDAALALAFANVIINEKLYDEDFVKKWTNGHFLVRTDKGEKSLVRESDIVNGGDRNKFVVWDTTGNKPIIWDSSRAEYESGDVKPAFEGEYKLTLSNGEIAVCKTVWTLYLERLSEYTPQMASEITWVPADKIIEAARFYARSKPAAIHWGLPIDTQTSTTPTAQSIANLWVLSGMLDVPGGNVIAKYPFDVVTYPYHSGVGVLDMTPEVNQKRIGIDKYGAIRDFRTWAQPDMVLDQIFSEKPYPIKAMWIQTANPLANTGLDPKKWYKAMKKMDFIVCVDLFKTPTAVLADIILPATSFLEKDSLKAWWVPLQAIKKLISVGDCKSDLEINFELAKRLNPEIKWKNIEELYDEILTPSGMTYKELTDKVWIIPPRGHPSAPYYRYDKGLLRKDGRPGFVTPSGKIEIYSSWFESWGLDPLPYFEEPPFSPVSTPDLYKKYPLIMITGRRSPVSFHSEHRQIPWLREIDPEAIIEINPKTANDLGISDGDMVWVQNQFGKCKRKAVLTPIIHPKTVMVPAGWWYPEKKAADPDLYGIWEVNVNQLIPMGYQGKSGHGAPIKSMLCKVYKAGGE